jgi:hypothetical protein
MSEIHRAPGFRWVAGFRDGFAHSNCAPELGRDLLIQISRGGTKLLERAESLEELRTSFARRHYFRLPELLDPGLLDLIQHQIDRGEFYERVHEGIDSNKELCMEGNAAFGALLLAVNDEKLFEFIQDITRCERIRCFEGRVYRVNPGEHHDSWHNDIGEDRLIGMSINLSREVYRGGLLQIRDHDSRQIISEVDNPGAGDAVVFRLSRDLQHRITGVAGGTSKTAFAGWFRARPDFLSLIKGAT